MSSKVGIDNSRFTVQLFQAVGIHRPVHHSLLLQHPKRISRHMCGFQHHKGEILFCFLLPFPLGGSLSSSVASGNNATGFSRIRASERRGSYLVGRPTRRWPVSVVRPRLIIHDVSAFGLTLIEVILAVFASIHNSLVYRLRPARYFPAFHR